MHGLAVINLLYQGYTLRNQLHTFQITLKYNLSEFLS